MDLSKGLRFLLVLAICGLAGGQILPQMGDFSCPKDFCDDYTKCQAVDFCTDGILLIDPNHPCSCCQKCITYIDEGESCNPAASDKVCGPGLTCKSNKCSKIVDSQCAKEQKKYDEDKNIGLVGLFSVRPNCDENGDFAGRKCQPGSSCYCVDKQGNRIFGEAPPSQAITDTDMNCACSRDQQETAVNLRVSALQFPHCLPNGNYDALQCTGLACYCLGSDLKPMSTLLPYTSIEDLPCYNPEIHNVNYIRVCEAEATRTQNLINEYARQNITILGLDIPNCTPDGFFAPVRKTDSKYYCADPMGDQIESFEADINSPDAEDMNCNCARTRYWLSNEPGTKPVCCKNGNYKRIQCRSGFCFCVDAETGDQDEGQNQSLMEVSMGNIDKLHCYQEYSADC